MIMTAQAFTIVTGLYALLSRSLLSSILFVGFALWLFYEERKIVDQDNHTCPQPADEFDDPEQWNEDLL